jgi:hypothetical protein
MMLKVFLVSVLVACIGGEVFAQTSIDVFTKLDARAPGSGYVDLQQDAGIADLVKMDVEANTKLGTIDGFRIQLYSGSGSASKKEAQDAKSAAMSAFPDQKVYLTFTAPFWRVRVGNFRNKSESLPVYYRLKRTFPNCYPVKDSGIRIADLQ